MNELALFAGAGGGILVGQLLGWHTLAAVEIAPYPRNVLLQRQRDGFLPPFPIWDDITTFDGHPFRGVIDIVTGGFPCQDISCAGRGKGISGSRSGLWSHMHRIICEVRPRYAFMENSPLLTSRGLHVVLKDLAESGYHAAWLVLGAADVGAPHQRNRIWILAQDSQVAHPSSLRLQETSVHGSLPPQTNSASPAISTRAGTAERVFPGTDMSRIGRRSAQPPEAGQAKLLPHAHLPGCQEQWRAQPAKEKHSASQCCHWWQAEPNVGRVVDGLASRVDRLKAIGNGQVPLVAATAFNKLQSILNTALNNHQ